MDNENRHIEDPSNNSYIRYKKKLAKPGVHCPGKNEAQLLRKLMSETGMNEAELREHKKYRKMLSDTQKMKPNTLSLKERKMKAVMKLITKELGLAKEHPKCITRFKEIWKQWNKKDFEGQVIIKK